MRKVTIFMFFLLTGFQVLGQEKSTQSLQQIWTGYFNQTRISDKWGLWFDAQLRTMNEFVEELSTTIVRPGITYYVNDNLKLTAGYGYISHYPQGSFTLIIPEHRPWQQVQWHTKYGQNRTMQYLRLEERFRRKVTPDSTHFSGHNFNWRLRYNFLWQIPLTKKDIGKGGLSVILNDEAHIAFGKEVVYNYFDQNRFFAGFGYHLNSHDNLQFGYMNIFQQFATGNRYRSNHVARIFYFHNLDLRLKKG